MHRGSCGDSMFAPLVQASTLPDVLSAVVASFSHLHEIIWVIVGCIFSILHLNSLSKTKVCQIWLDPPQSHLVLKHHLPNGPVIVQWFTLVYHAIPCHTINQDFSQEFLSHLLHLPLYRPPLGFYIVSLLTIPNCYRRFTPKGGECQ